MFNVTAVNSIYKSTLAITLGLLVFLLAFLILSMVLNQIFFSLTSPPFLYMDPESNAIEFSKHTTYLIADNLVWLASIALAGITSSAIYTRAKYSNASIIGGVIFIIYFLNLPPAHITDLYPAWYIYSPLFISLSIIFIGPAILRKQ